MATVHSYMHSKVSDPLRHVQNERFKESRKPKVVAFYPNGKPNIKPHQMRITPHKYNSFNDLLKDLTKNVKLPFGVRRVYTPVGGTEIDDLDDLEDGNTYLCASFERFKPASYGKQSETRPEWGLVGGHITQNNPEVLYTNLGYTPSNLQNAGARGAGFRQYYYRNDKSQNRSNRLKETDESGLFAPPVKRTLQKGTFGVASRDKYAGSMGHLGSRAPPQDSKLTGYAKKFRIVYDTEPAKGYDFMFNEKTSDNFERILQYVSETLKQNLRKFFTLKNREIKSLRELYRCPEDVLIATAKEQITEATIKAVREAIYSFKNGPSNTSKNDSGFGEGPDSDLERTPRVKPASLSQADSQKGQSDVSLDVAQRARIKNASPNRKPKRVIIANEGELGDPETATTTTTNKPSNQQLSQVHQRRREKEDREKEKLAHQNMEKSEEEKRRKRQQARLDNENRRRLKRLQSEKPKMTSMGEANKENKKPSSFAPTEKDISAAELAENNRRKAESLKKDNRADSLEAASVVRHDKTNDDKLREQAEKAEQKRKRLQEEKERQIKKDREDKLTMEQGLRALNVQSEAEKRGKVQVKPVDDNIQFEEANFIKKKKPKSEAPKMLSFDSEAKILKDAEDNEKERAKRDRETAKLDAVELDRKRATELEAAERVKREKEEEETLLAAEAAAKQQKQLDAEKKKQEQFQLEEAERKRKEAEEEKRKAEKKEEKRKAAEEEERRKAAEEEERLKAEEEKKKAELEARRLAEEEAERARKAAALEEAARLRKAEEERQRREVEEKERKEREAEAQREKEREEREAAEKKRQEAEAEAERKRLADEEVERKRLEAEEAARKAREAAEAEEKRKQAEAAAKEKPRAKGLILPIYEEEEIERKYELKKKMGDGNFANVYQAVLKQGEAPPGAPSDMKEYAVKQIDKSKVVGSRKNTSSKVQMLKNEIDIMKACDHPNICKLYEAYETEKHVYLIMEFVKGGDLFDAISENIKFDEPQSSLIIRHLAEALEYLHSRKIVHRDIKPENLLVDKDEKGKIVQVKLGDFGLAMHVKEKIYSVCGTPTYVAPEILAETGYGLEVDNWATGVISYILLCGFPPFRSIERNQDELFDTIQRGEFEYLSPYWDNISDMAKDLIDQLLVVEIRKRMKSPNVLKHKFITTHKQ